MHRRTIIYISASSYDSGTYPSSVITMRQAVEDRGDAVVATFPDPSEKRHVGWRTILGRLDGIDQIAVPSAAHLPGRRVGDLLALLAQLRDHEVTLLLVSEDIDIGGGSPLVLLDLIAAYRKAKLSQAIRASLARVKAEGKRLGRPEVPPTVRARIQAALATGAGVRPTARLFGVAPGTVINIRAAAAIHAESA